MSLSLRQLRRRNRTKLASSGNTFARNQARRSGALMRPASRARGVTSSRLVSDVSLMPPSASCLWEGGCSDYIQCDEAGAQTDRWRQRNFTRQCYFNEKRRRIAPPRKIRPLPERECLSFQIRRLRDNTV